MYRSRLIYCHFSKMRIKSYNSGSWIDRNQDINDAFHLREPYGTIIDRLHSRKISIQSPYFYAEKQGFSQNSQWEFEVCLSEVTGQFLRFIWLRIYTTVRIWGNAFPWMSGVKKVVQEVKERYFSMPDLLQYMVDYRPSRKWLSIPAADCIMNSGRFFE